MHLDTCTYGSTSTIMNKERRQEIREKHFRKNLLCMGCMAVHCDVVEILDAFEKLIAACSKVGVLHD